MVVTHLNLAVGDIAASVQFYVEELGFELFGYLNGGSKAVLRSGGFDLFLFSDGAFVVEPKLHFGFRVNRRELRQRFWWARDHGMDFRAIYSRNMSDFFLSKILANGDIEVDVDASRAMGADMTILPEHGPGRGESAIIPVSSEGHLRLYVRDPDGYEIEFYEDELSLPDDGPEVDRHDR